MKKCVILLISIGIAAFAAPAVSALSEEPVGSFVITPEYEQNIAGSGCGYYFFDTGEPSDPIFRYWWFRELGWQSWADNDAYWTTTVPFDVRFCGVDYPAGSTLYVGSNGILGFVEAGMDEPINQDLPDPTAPNGIIAGWWDDLDGTEGAMYRDYKENPNTGEWALAISYIPMYFVDSSPDDAIKFQIQIYEQVYPGTNNRIEFQYFDSIGDSWRDSGASATIGLENQDGTDAALYSFDQEVLSDLFGIRFIDQVVYDSRLGAFDLLEPEDGSEISLGDSVTFRWEQPSYGGGGELTFFMLFADNPELTNPLELDVGASNFKEIIFGTFGLDPGQWYWSVRCEEPLLDNTRMADSVWSFDLVEIQDDTPPQVTGQNPANGETGVPPGQNIIFHVTDDMSGVNVSTIDFTCASGMFPAGGGTLSVGGSPTALIPGQLDIDDSDPLDVICTFDPDQPLPKDTINCTVVAGLSDMDGNSTTQDIIWSFQVQGADVKESTWGAIKADFE